MSPFLASFLPGNGAAVVTSLTSTGTVQGTIVRGTTALEFPANASAPGVRCTTDTDTGIGRDSTNELALFGGGVAIMLATNAQILTASGSETVFLGELETRATRQVKPQTVDIAAVSTTVPITGGSNVYLTVAAGGITSTAAPFIVDGSDGQEIELTNIDSADALVLNTDGNAGVSSNLKLRSATRTLAAGGGYLALKFSTATGLWQEQSFG